MLAKFFEEFAYSINPLKYTFLSHQKPGKAIKFSLKLLILCFLISIILLIPNIATYGEYLSDELSKIDLSEVGGNWSTSSPILLPENEPFIIIDTTSQTKINKENVLITRDYLYFKTLGRIEKIKLEDFKDWQKIKKETIFLLLIIALIILPYITLIALCILFIKYLLTACLASFIAWTLLDLTYFKIKLSRVFNTALYATVFLIPLEILSFPFGTTWLMQNVEIFRVKFFFLSTIIYIALFLFITIYLAIHHKKSRKEDYDTL